MSGRRRRIKGVKLLLLRHGETEWNAAERYQGMSNTALSPRGQAQAKAVAAALDAETIDRVLCSPLRRAYETAVTALFTPGRYERHQHLLIMLDRRLCEISFGEWEGLTYGEISQLYPDALQAWLADPLNCAPPGGETLTEVATRVGQLLEELRAAPAGESILLVGHGGSLSVLLCLALGISPDRRWQIGLSHAALSELHLYPEGAILMRHNDTHHLRFLDRPSARHARRKEARRG